MLSQRASERFKRSSEPVSERSKRTTDRLHMRSQSLHSTIEQRSNRLKHGGNTGDKAYGNIRQAHKASFKPRSNSRTHVTQFSEQGTQSLSNSEIGRASCREREESTERAVAVKREGEHE